MWDWYYTSSTPSLNQNLCSWVFAVTRINLFMIILRSMCVLCLRRKIIKKIYFTWLRKRLYSSRLIFNNWSKLTKNLIKKISRQEILLHFSRSTGSVKIFSWHWFFLASKGVGLSLDIWPSRKAFKRLCFRTLNCCRW